MLICQRFPYGAARRHFGALIELRAGSAAKSIEYLTIAAQQVDSFYGVVARKALGQKVDLSFDLPPLDDVFAMAFGPPRWPAYVCIAAIGKTHLAGRELRYLWMEMPQNL